MRRAALRLPCEVAKQLDLRRFHRALWPKPGFRLKSIRRLGVPKQPPGDDNVGRMQFLLGLRRRGISDPAVLRAMDEVPREHFVENSFVDNAYADQALPIASGWPRWAMTMSMCGSGMVLPAFPKGRPTTASWSLPPPKPSPMRSSAGLPTAV